MHGEGHGDVGKHALSVRLSGAAVEGAYWGTAPAASTGDVDANGDLVGELVRRAVDVTRERRLRSAICAEGAYGEAQLASVTRMLAARRGSRQ